MTDPPQPTVEQRLAAVLALHVDGADYNTCASCSFGLASSCPTVLAATGKGVPPGTTPVG